MGRIKRATRLDSLISLSRVRSIQVFTGLLILYLIVMGFEIPVAFKAGFGLGSESPGLESNESLVSHPLTINDNQFSRKEQQKPVFKAHERKMGKFKKVSGLIFDDDAYNSLSDDVFSELHMVAREAFALGKKALDELESGKVSIELESQTPKLAEEPCPNSVVLSRDVPVTNGTNLMMIPCGLSLGSHITVVGRPRRAHVEKNPNIALVQEKDKGVMVSQFVMELQGLRAVDGEDPPKIFHFNPRLRGDWSGRPVIEHNTCYRMQWGSAQRCEGWKSKADEDAVDGKVKCEKWNRENNSSTEDSKAAWWLKRLVGRTKAVSVDWPYPFAENKLFVLTIIAGLEGFHINVDGRHVSSFPYRPGFTLEDATGFYVDGDVDIQSIVAAALPALHPSTAPKRYLEMSPKWKAPNIINGSVELFIGILSAGNHFAERMAVRKSWMQYESVGSGNVVARFFVAMHARKEVNVELMKEADYFGDIVIVPYMDNYDLVVLKTVAICEYGVNVAAAKYVMKCDDDTFVRIDAVMAEINEIQTGTSFYVGNINYYHRPLRHGKWAVTYEEYPEEVYPPYANGPGYVISSDIAEYVISVFKKHRLRLFKMEDVSMGMWVKEYSSSSSTRQAVQYKHSLKYCQFGCIEGYITAHYQSPQQMICLWGKLQLHGKPFCCNAR